MRTLFVTLRALVFSSAFVTLWGWVAWRIRAFDAGLGRLPEWTPGAGLALMAAGAALALACIATFVFRGEGTPAPFDAPRRFVAAGPYRVIRNPMYVGGGAALAGFALYGRSPEVLLFTAAWLLSAHLLVLVYEEPTLHARFGSAYDLYRRAVPRWLPRIAAVKN